MRINKICLAAIIAAFGLGYALNAYLRPKPNSSSVEQERTRVRTVTRIVEQNGRRETLIEHIDNSTASKTLMIAKKPQWLVGAGVAYDLPASEVVYEAQVSRRVLGPIFLGVKADTRGTVGMQALLEF